MILRTVTFCCVLAAAAFALVAQEKKATTSHHDKMVGSWIVHYDRNDDIAHFPKAKRKSEAIRLVISKRGSAYTAQVRRFVLSGTAYSLAGSWDADLTVEGGSGGKRKRIAFYSAPVAPDRLEIKGVWQMGKDKTRKSERIQLLRWIKPIRTNDDPKKKKGEFDDCDEEPDSDVLEEEDPPVADPNTPPADPDP
jgi:hypothetical protein